MERVRRLHSLERILTFKIHELLSLYYKYCEFNRICCFLLSNRKKTNYYLESILVLIGDSDTESYRMDVSKITRVTFASWSSVISASFFSVAACFASLPARTLVSES